MNYIKRRLAIVTAVMVAFFLNGCASVVSPDTEVVIKRDLYGTPHVYANDVKGLFYGMGYAVAEDRLFQWEMLKRMARGTVAEVLGAEYIKSDQLARAGYDPHQIQQQIEALPQDERAILKGYVAGYNARLQEVLDQPDLFLPIQFNEFGFMPTFIDEVDVVGVYIRTIATNFSDANEEVGNYALLTELRKIHGHEKGLALFNQLRWVNDPKSPVTISDDEQIEQPDKNLIVDRWDNGLVPISYSTLSKHRNLSIALHKADGPNTYPIASNLWIFSPDKTEINRAVFVNGPQYGNNVPGYPFGIALHGAGWDAVGASSWGLPLLNWGTNGEIAWGVTVGYGDTTDVFQVKLHPFSHDLYEYKGQWLPFAERVETIKVKDSDPVKIEFFSTIHGQVLFFDSENNTAYAKKRSWQGKEVSSLITWLQLSKVKNWSEFLSLGKSMPLSMNWYYIDKDQNIGYAFLGHFPIKSENLDPRLPTPGNGEYEWQGLLDFQYLPKIKNPSKGYIANWNNKPQENWNNSDSLIWGQVDRVDVVEDYIDKHGRLSLSEINNLNRHASYQNININYFKPFFLELLEQPKISKDIKTAAQLIIDWDGRMMDEDGDGYYDAPGYALFNEWLRLALHMAFNPHVPEPFLTQLLQVNELRGAVGTMALLNALQGEDAGVKQDFDVLGVDRVTFMRNVMQEVLKARKDKRLEQMLYPVRTHDFSVETFGGVPINSPSEAMVIDTYMNRGTSNHQVIFYPDGVEYLDVLPPGQSGFIGPNGVRSPHYDDQLDLYANFEYKQGWLKPEQVEKNQSAVIKLRVR